MKSIIKYSILLAIVFAVACQPDDFKPMGETKVKSESILGTWTVSKVVQIDEKAQFGLEEMDITDLMSFTETTMTIGSGGTVTINYGAAPQLIPNETTWQLVNNDGEEDNEYPTKLKLGSTELALLGVAFQTGELKFSLKLSNNSSGVYHFTLTK